MKFYIMRQSVQDLKNPHFHVLKSSNNGMSFSDNLLEICTAIFGMFLKPAFCLLFFGRLHTLIHLSFAEDVEGEGSVKSEEASVQDPESGAAESGAVEEETKAEEKPDTETFQ